MNNNRRIYNNDSNEDTNNFTTDYSLLLPTTYLLGPPTGTYQNIYSSMNNNINNTNNQSNLVSASTISSPQVPTLRNENAQAIRFNVLNSSLNEANNQRRQLRTGPFLTYLATVTHTPQIIISIIYLIICKPEISLKCNKIYTWLFVQTIFLTILLVLHWIISFIEGNTCCRRNNRNGNSLFLLGPWTYQGFDGQDLDQNNRRQISDNQSTPRNYNNVYRYPNRRRQRDMNSNIRQNNERLRQYIGYIYHIRYMAELTSLVWFVVGNMWLISEQGKCNDTSIYRVMVGVIIVNYLEIFLPCILLLALLPILCFCLPCVIRLLRYLHDPMRGKGATKDIIQQLEIIKYTDKFKEEYISTPTNGDKGGNHKCNGCCICLNEYEINQELRILPCKHHFHKECVDEWLRINATCPTCRTPIVPVSSKDNSNGEGEGEEDNEDEDDYERGQPSHNTHHRISSLDNV